MALLKAIISAANVSGSAATPCADNSAGADQKHIYRMQALGFGAEAQASRPAQIIVQR